METSLAGLSTLQIFVEVTEQMLQDRRILAQCSNSFKVQDKHSSENGKLNLPTKENCVLSSLFLYLYHT